MIDQTYTYTDDQGERFEVVAVEQIDETHDGLICVPLGTKVTHVAVEVDRGTAAPAA